MNYQSKSRLRESLEQTLYDLNPNFFVTHNFWGKQNAITQQLRMSKFYSVIQRKGLGEDWASFKAQDRVAAYGFREHPYSNAHYHVLARVPLPTAAILTKVGGTVWKRMARGGQLDVRPITTDQERQQAISYPFKEFHRFAAEDMFVYSTGSY